MLDFFSPTEQALLSDYFGIPRKDSLSDVDIHLEPEYGGEWVDSKDDKALEATVAHIALAVIQDRLPQCASVSETEITLFRQPFTRHTRSVEMLPRHLFTINWADTAPGISWPEAYYLTYIPDFDRHIVTASMDSTDMWGFNDLAIGHFGPETAWEVGSRNVITGWWRFQLNRGDQDRYAYVLEAGLIDDVTANMWANDVWTDSQSDTQE